MFWYTGVMVPSRSREEAKPRGMRVAGYGPRLGEAYHLALAIAENLEEWDLDIQKHFWPNDVRSGCPEWFVHEGRAAKWKVHILQPNFRWHNWIKGPAGGWRLSPPGSWGYWAAQTPMVEAEAGDGDDGGGGVQLDGDGGGGGVQLSIEAEGQVGMQLAIEPADAVHHADGAAGPATGSGSAQEPPPVAALTQASSSSSTVTVLQDTDNYVGDQYFL